MGIVTNKSKSNDTSAPQFVDGANGRYEKALGFLNIEFKDSEGTYRGIDASGALLASKRLQASLVEFLEANIEEAPGESVEDKIKAAAEMLQDRFRVVYRPNKATAEVKW